MNSLVLLVALVLGQSGTLEKPPLVDQSPVKIKGSIEFKENQRIVNLWGTHYEMGYAHGRLLGREIMELIEGYGLAVSMDPYIYATQILPLVQFAFVVPTTFDEELEGMYDGVVESGTDIHIDVLGRDLIKDDLLVMNLIADLGQLDCSVTFGWGWATALAPELAGGSAFVRNLDWGDDPTGYLFTRSIVLAFHSSLPDERPFVSLSWPGLISVLTVMNEDGVAAAINYGNHQDYGFIYPKRYTGIGFSMRTGIEKRDYDGNGFENHFDVHAAILAGYTLASFEISLLSPYPVPGNPSADSGAVLEINYYGDALRDTSNNMDHTPYLNSSWLLAVTNHHRLLYTPSYCNRYNNQVSRLSGDYRVDTQELWEIEEDISNIWTHQMVCFRPNLMDLYVAFNETFQGAANSNRVHYAWSDLFPNH